MLSLGYCSKNGNQKTFDQYLKKNVWYIKNTIRLLENIDSQNEIMSVKHFY